MGACGSRGTMAMGRLYEWDEKEVLGEGCGSTTFRGKTRASGELVAIKRIEKKEGTNASSLWEDEVAMLQQCAHHPNIIELKHVFHTPESVFLVTEFAEGGELFQTLISNGAYSEWDAKRFAYDIFQALQFMHERNIVHRDIKPENLLLSSVDTACASIKLADFGMAAIIQGNRFLGVEHLTWAYCSPEVLVGDMTQENPFAAKGDIWSVGIVLYVLLSATHPFDTDGRQTKDQMIDNILHGTYSLDSDVWDVISQPAKHLLRRLLAHDPSERPTAAEALEDAWFKAPDTPRDSLSISMSDGLGQYQRLMRKKFRTSVVVAMAATALRRSLYKYRESMPKESAPRSKTEEVSSASPVESPYYDIVSSEAVILAGQASVDMLTASSTQFPEPEFNAAQVVEPESSKSKSAEVEKQ